MISLTDGGNLSAQAPALHMFVLLVHENGGEMTLNRIVVVSMVRNEEDIIESFVRWHCAIADARSQEYGSYKGNLVRTAR